MTAWSIDLGFDQNAKLNTDAAGKSVAYLEWGAVNCSGGTHTQADLNDVQTNDTIVFNIFDVTELNNGTGSASGGTPSLSAPAGWTGWQWITMSSNDPNTSASNPFSGNSFSTLQSGASLSAQMSGYSTVFSTSQQQTFPQWQVQLSGQQAQLTVSATTLGNYLYSIRLWVSFPGNSATKVFEVDPEMIVNPGG